MVSVNRLLCRTHAGLDRLLYDSPLICNVATLVTVHIVHLVHSSWFSNIYNIPCEVLQGVFNWIEHLCLELLSFPTRLLILVVITNIHVCMLFAGMWSSWNGISWEIVVSVQLVFQNLFHNYEHAWHSFHHAPSIPVSPDVGWHMIGSVSLWRLYVVIVRHLHHSGRLAPRNHESERQSKPSVTWLSVTVEFGWLPISCATRNWESLNFEWQWNSRFL
jgi:hypothetical protein